MKRLDKKLLAIFGWVTAGLALVFAAFPAMDWWSWSREQAAIRTLDEAGISYRLRLTSEGFFGQVYERWGDSQSTDSFIGRRAMRLASIGFPNTVAIHEGQTDVLTDTQVDVLAAQMNRLKRVELLRLVGPTVDDDRLPDLLQSPRLKSVFLDRTSVTGQGLLASFRGRGPDQQLTLHLVKCDPGVVEDLRAYGVDVHLHMHGQ